ncbi:membrane associated rhomboid family serine protease [Pontibacter ummariensis]|uniref:Membrane associated serine protease, rhomboid family n=1 Tax=Pontibacter ummariensis TaxID=1610492 RepID=A0A239JPZ7_9BACT|nr:rhomboid family intramembrane serine protease [Pontibacter ummariensis]PRY07362.1 membrane associated rhomboid family serine protease [Pontibacter ummariensis]SNT07612.1 Membrane associated serine protease, rhomboid family [Pontibacter ummariensis]
MPTTFSGKDGSTLHSQAVNFGYSFLPSALFVALMWLVGLLSYLTDAYLGWLGIYPRRFFGLIGVVTGPLIHNDLLHLLSNSFPLVLLSGFILFMHRQKALNIHVLVYVLSGLLTWLIGRQAYHIGASGVVYGLAGFLLFNGFLRQNRGSMAISFAVLFLYSGLFYGLFPNEEGVSWEGHLAGLLSGLVAAIGYGEGNLEQAEAQRPLEPDVVQRHMSNTMSRHDQYLRIRYTVKEGPEPGKSYSYTYNPDTGDTQVQTKSTAHASFFRKRST